MVSQDTNNRFLVGAKATALLAGGTMGAGVLGVPYVIMQSGFKVGIFYLIFVGILMVILNLMLGEVSLRVKGTQQLPGLAEKFLGQAGKRTMFFALFVLITGASIAYISGSGQALGQVFEVPPILASVVFFSLAALLVYRGIKTVSQFELFFISGVVLITLGIVANATSSGIYNVEHLLTFGGWQNFFVPYGVVMFSFFGVSSVPEMEKILGKNVKDLDNAIVVGTLIPLFVYILFVMAVLGVMGMRTTEVATVGLETVLGRRVGIIGNSFAVMTMFTSYVMFSTVMRDIFHQDFGLPKEESFWLTMLLPFALFLAGFTNFITVLGFTGALAGSIIGVLIVIIFWKAKNMSDGLKPAYDLGELRLWGSFIISLLILGFCSQLWSF
jgi:amino acid permease